MTAFPTALSAGPYLQNRFSRATLKTVMARPRHDQPADYNRVFAIGVSLNLAFVFIEAGCGIVTNSLALVARRTQSEQCIELPPGPGSARLSHP